MPTQTATPIPTQLNIAPRGKCWKDWQLVDGEIGFPTREAMEKYHCHPERVQALEEERLALLESNRQLNQLNDRQAAQIKALEAQMEAIGAGGVEPLRKQIQLAAVQQGVQPSPESDSIAPTLMTNDQAIAWAWADVRKDVGTENWTTGDSCNFYGFFLHGWNYRVQYELQRNATKAAVMREIATHPAQQGRDLAAVIKSAADKLDAAKRCHPNAVETLIDEALEILDGDRDPTQQGLDAQALKQSFREYLLVSEHIDADGHTKDSIATDLTNIVLAEEEVSAVIARRVHCNTSGQAGEDAAHIRSAAKAKQGEQANG